MHVHKPRQQKLEWSASDSPDKTQKSTFVVQEVETLLHIWFGREIQDAKDLKVVEHPDMASCTVSVYVWCLMDSGGQPVTMQLAKFA
jgi:hypothetical protein